VKLAILVGGEGKRLGGVEKSQLKLCGKKIIDILLERFRRWEVVVVCRNEKQKSFFRDVESIIDTVEGFGPLSAIHSALNYFGETTAILATDMPFVKEEVIRELYKSSLRMNAWVLMPYWRGGKFEPLMAVYSPPVMKEIERSFKKNERKILDPVFRAGNVFLYDVECLRKIDKRLLSFFNINTKEDLERAEKLCSSMHLVEE